MEEASDRFALSALAYEIRTVVPKPGTAQPWLPLAAHRDLSGQQHPEERSDVLSHGSLDPARIIAFTLMFREASSSLGSA
jgi:hypothetical protein